MFCASPKASELWSPNNLIAVGYGFLSADGKPSISMRFL